MSAELRLRWRVPRGSRDIACRAGTAAQPHRAALLLLWALGATTGCRRLEPDAHPAIPVFPGYVTDGAIEVVPIDFGGRTLESVTHDGRDSLIVVVSEATADVHDRQPHPRHLEIQAYQSGELVRRHAIAGEYEQFTLFRDAHGTVQVWLDVMSAEVHSRNLASSYRTAILRPPYDRLEVVPAAPNTVPPEAPDEPFVSPERPDPRVTRFDVVAVERWWPNYRTNFLPAYREIQYFRATVDGHAFEYKLDDRRETEFTWVVGPMHDDPHGLWLVHKKPVDGAFEWTLYRARVRR